MERLLAEVDGAPGALVYLKATADGKLIVDSGAGPTPDRELIVTTYYCKTAFAGSDVGDTITATQIIDVSGATPSTVNTVWRNQTMATDLASAPSSACLTLVGSTALTAAQLTAAGLALEATQQSILTRATDIRAGLGERIEDPATSDAGAASVIQLIKRALQNWTALLGRIPALVSNRIPVDGSGVTQPVSAAELPLPTGAADAASQAAANQLLAEIDASIGTTSEQSSPWFTSTASAIALLKLQVAAFVGAGSKTYAYDTSGRLSSEVWSFLGTTRTKSYTYNASGKLSAESDWV